MIYSNIASLSLYFISISSHHPHMMLRECMRCEHSHRTFSVQKYQFTCRKWCLFFLRMHPLCIWPQLFAKQLNVTLLLKYHKPVFLMEPLLQSYMFGLSFCSLLTDLILTVCFTIPSHGLILSSARLEVILHAHVNRHLKLIFFSFSPL